VQPHHFDNISAEDVKLFLLKQMYKSLLFTSRDSTAHGGRCMESCSDGATSEQPQGRMGQDSQGVESLAGTVRQAAQHMRTRWAGPPGSSACDLAIPVGQDSPLPAVLFRQMAQSGWVPEPDVFEMPDADKLHAVIRDHITRMNTWASPVLISSLPLS